jgi:hypothetical protein
MELSFRFWRSSHYVASQMEPTGVLSYQHLSRIAHLSTWGDGNINLIIVPAEPGRYSGIMEC